MDRKYLEPHGNQWRVKVKVSAAAKSIIKKSHLVRPLHTDSLAVANRLKHRIVADLKDEIAKAVTEARRKAAKPTDQLLAEALDWHEALKHEAENPQYGEPEPGEHDDRRELLTPASDLLSDRVDEVRATHGSNRALFFNGVARGKLTPITAPIDAWLAERLMKPRQKLDYKRAVTRFADWLVSVKLPSNIEDTERKTAGRYVTEAFVGRGVHWKTANKSISALSGYWKWMNKKGYASENIWTLQSLPKVKLRGEDDRKKRPFTDDEVRTLLMGNPKLLLSDASKIAALSGMRTEEIARLKVEHCTNGIMRVTDAKTAAGIRSVPIHSDIVAIIERRSSGKPSDAYLFDELKTPPKGSAMERGQPITKGFVGYRRRLKVDDRREGGPALG